MLQGSSGGVPTTRRISATPLPVSIALAGQTNARLWRNVRTTSMTAQVTIAARICGTLTWKPSADLPEDVDRDDHRRDMQARIADARQDERVAGAAQREGPGGHDTGRRTLDRIPKAWRCRAVMPRLSGPSPQCIRSHLVVRKRP